MRESKEFPGPITPESAIQYHDMVIKVYGGNPGIKDFGLLESALFSPFQEVFGIEPYPTMVDKAARLCFCIASNHSFNDGNKRTATALMLQFLEDHGLKPTLTNDEITEIVVNLADHKITYEEFADLLRNNLAAIDQPQTVLHKTELETSIDSALIGTLIDDESNPSPKFSKDENGRQFFD